MVEFGQGFGWMNAPTKEFERLMILGRILHPAHPMMDWMVGNCQFAVDAEGRVKLVKADGKKKGPGKLPKLPEKPGAKDSREAAVEALRAWSRRR